MTAQEYATSIISGLVSYKDEIFIDETRDEMGVLLSVSVAPSDMGRVIGKQGNTSMAIRHLLNSFGNTLDPRQKISVKILEPSR